MNKGNVKIRITGKNINFFVKRILINKIKYSKYKNINKNEIELIINYEDYLKLNKKNSIYNIRIVKYYGAVKYLNFIKENMFFVINFLLSFVFLFIISNVCFDIDIVHNDKKIRNLLQEELKENGIDKYHFIPNFNKRKKIIGKILKNKKDVIEWLEIERKGSKLIVKLTERKINSKKEDLLNRHIVAKKSGIIKKIEASSGVIVKKVNDYVTSGDIIVSGDIIKDEIVKGQVVSKGVVYAETWYKVNVEYPLYYEEIKYLDDIKNNIVIKFLNSSFSLRKNCDEFYFEKEKPLIKQKIFPFSISIQKQRKIKKIKQKLTSNEALLKATKLATDKIIKKLDNDEYIISKKTLNFSIKESKIVVDVFFKIYENITDYKNVDSIINDKIENN